MSTFLTFTVELRDKLITSLRRDIQSYTAGTGRTHMKREAMRALMNIERGMLATSERGYGRFIVATACARTTATLAAVANNDTIVIGGTTLTAKTSSADGTTQFTRGVSNTADAAALAACINANTTLNKIVRATSAAAVVTITCLYPGPIGNQIALTAAATITLANATLVNGASDAVDGYEYGYAPTV